MQHTDKLGAVHCIPDSEEAAREHAQLEELGDGLVLVHCKGGRGEAGGEGQPLVSTFPEQDTTANEFSIPRWGLGQMCHLSTNYSLLLSFTDEATTH